MKKTLVVVCVLLMLFSFSTISNAKWGIGVEEIEPGYGYGWSPFVAFEPIPSLQLRIGADFGVNPKTIDNDYADSHSEIFLSGLYRLWTGNIVPFIGARVSVYNDFEDYYGRYIDMDGSVLFGFEWSVLNNLSLYINTEILSSYTVLNEDGDPLYAGTYGLGNEFDIGAVIYF